MGQRVAMDLLKSVKSVIVVCPIDVKMDAVIRRRVDCDRMQHVRRVDAVIWQRVNRMRAVLSVDRRPVNVIYPNTVRAKMNSVRLIIISVTRNRVTMAMRIATEACASHVITNANCCGVRRADRRSSATIRIWKLHGMVIVALIASQKCIGIVHVRMCAAVCCSVGIWTSGLSLVWNRWRCCRIRMFHIMAALFHVERPLSIWGCRWKIQVSVHNRL